MQQFHSPAELLQHPTAYPRQRRKDFIKDWLFRRVHSNKLVYNTCWEDPRTDRAMMELDQDSEVVMITSAGDNALAYLLDNPAKINCIDVNPRQNALLDLKRAAYQQLEWPLFFEIFGRGKTDNFANVYQQLRSSLRPESQSCWDSQQRYFKPKGLRKGLYYHGSCGFFAWCAGQLLNVDQKLKKQLEELFEAPDMETQRALYLDVENRLLDRMVGKKIRQKVGLSLLGVPDAQRAFIEHESGGLRNYVREAFRRVFMELPIQENYFYLLYLKGEYSYNCCPAYLETANYSTLNDRVDRLQLHTTTIADFLNNNPGAYSHFVLLDHQDWLAAHDPAALAEEWKLVLANSRPGTRILLRSAYSRPETVLDFVRDRVRFRNDLSEPQAKLDRVGTYAGTFLLEVL